MPLSRAHIGEPGNCPRPPRLPAEPCYMHAKTGTEGEGGEHGEAYSFAFTHARHVRA
jgi:hypothetical protein